MRLNEFVGSIFYSLPEPEETYREGCFNYQKWHFDTNSQDEKWFIMRREFITLNEQVFDWLDRFPVSETLRLDAKRLIWDMKYENYRNYRFSHPVLIALCSLRISCELHNSNFNDILEKCILIAKPQLEYKRILGMRLSDANMKERIKEKSNQLKELIGDEKINNIKRMWGCIDEAILLA